MKITIMKGMNKRTRTRTRTSTRTSTKTRTRTRRIVAKASDGQRYPLPLCKYMWVCDGERGSGPKGADDLCSVSFEALGLNLSINNGI